MKEFFKKLGKKLKKIFGWVVYFLIILIWAIYDYFYQSKTHWKIFKMQLPQYIRLGAIILALFLILKKKGLIKTNGNGADNEAGAEEKNEKTKDESAGEAKDESASEAKDEPANAEEQTDEKRR